jgi:hypothetical protein
MPVAMIPIIVSQSQPASLGPALFQLIGMVVVFVWFVTRDGNENDYYAKREREEAESKLRKQAQAEAESHYAKQAGRFENQPIDTDKAVLAVVSALALVGVSAALACMWGLL